MTQTTQTTWLPRLNAKIASLGLALGLLSGCGVTYYDPNPVPRGGPGNGQQDVALFPIDPGAGVDLEDREYAITTNGRQWTLAWTGDQVARQFSGQVLSGGAISGVLFEGGFPGDRVTQPAAGQVDFLATTDGGTVQSITLTSQTDPLRFNLYIDGRAAVYRVVFSSLGVRSTADEMPFDLTTQAGAAGGRTIARAPAHDGAAAGVHSQAQAQARTGRFVPAPARTE